MMGSVPGTTEFDNCGKCLLGVRRLSRVKDTTSSPQRQEEQVLKAVAAVGGHVIGWADDWEVSGAVDPLERPQLGPWLRGERGPYAGIVGADVSRIGRDVQDVINTGFMMRDTGRLLITFGHDGPWNLDDRTDLMRFMFEAYNAHAERSLITERNRNDTVRARNAGEVKYKNPYGYRWVRSKPTGKVDVIELDPVASKVLREVAERILNDKTGKITAYTEAARLTRAGVPAPSDHRALMYGRESRGLRWSGKSLAGILTSEASLGFLMHAGRAVIGQDGRPVRLADPLWDRATRKALIEKTTPKHEGVRAPRGLHLLAGIAVCGVCGRRLETTRAKGGPSRYICTGRVLGLPGSSHCKPAPSMDVPKLDEIAEARFLEDYGKNPLFRREFYAGTGYAAQIAELEEDLIRLRDDRAAGLYNSPADSQWFRERYTALSAQAEELKALPERPAGMRWVFTGETVADRWHQAADAPARREIMADWEVKVELFPRGHSAGRVWVHGLDPDTEAETRAALAKLAAEQAAADDDARWGIGAEDHRR